MRPAVRARLAVIGKTRRSLLAQGHARHRSGYREPTHAWEFDAEALQAEAAADGWYALLTNLDAAHAGSADVPIRFKGQEASERRYGNYKGPLAVAPLFVKHNRRIDALITVICLALLTFCLIERHIRAQIAPRTAISRPIRGEARPPHRLADLPRTGRDAAHPRHRDPASGHPAADTAAAASAGTPWC